MRGPGKKRRHDGNREYIKRTMMIMAGESMKNIKGRAIKIKMTDLFHGR